MGSDDLFRKRREERKQRRHEYKNPRANSFLIVTEGKCTEPFYFEGLGKRIKEKVGGTVEIVEKPVVDIYGEGCSTGTLIDVADQIVKEAKIIYQNVWIVFDRDEFRDFDQAIKAAEDKGYHVAWSNPSFEYWLYLHFHYSDSALYRKEWNRKLDEIFKQYHLGDGKYAKNYKNIYEQVDVFDGVNNAINNAKRRMSRFNREEYKPSEYDPGTTVHKLVEKLKRYLEE